MLILKMFMFAWGFHHLYVTLLWEGTRTTFWNGLDWASTLGHGFQSNGCLLIRGIWQPNYHQGKRFPNKKRDEKNMKTYEGKACFMFAYHLATLIVLQ